MRASTETKTARGGTLGIGIAALVLVTSVSALLLRLPKADPPASAVAAPERSGQDLMAIALPTQPTQAPEVLARLPSPSPQASASATKPPLTPEEAKAKQVAAHRAAIAAHDAEPRDTGWAEKTASAIRGDLTRIAARAKFEIVDVDCRTTTCVAALRFPNYGGAMNGWQQVLFGQMTTHCANEITLEDPTDPSKPFTASTIYDCKDVRAE